MARNKKVKAIIAHLEDKKIKKRIGGGSGVAFGNVQKDSNLYKKLKKLERRQKDEKIKEKLKRYGSRSDKIHKVISKSRQIKRGKVNRKTSKGRPKGTLKIRINPFTGKPIKIPAKQYYKLVKQYRQQSQAVSQNVDTQEVRQLARRGIPPEQARVIVNARQIRQAVPQLQRPQVQRQVVQPQAYQAEYQRIQQMQPWARRSAMQQLQRRMQVDQRLQNEGRTRLPTPHQPQRVEVNLMTGRPMLNQNSFQRREKWTN